MRGRAKRIQGLIALALAQPLVTATLPHGVRAALADLSAELLEINERLEKLEAVNDGKEPDRAL